jgi:hypothetical protein
MSIWDRDGNGDLTTTGLEQQQDWLSSDSEKIVICDIVYHNGTDEQIGYFSNYPYITPWGTSFTDILGNPVDNMPYIDNLINIPNIISKIDSDVNIGAIEFLNADGEFDSFIAYAWEGWPLRIYIGAKSWEKDDFILILEGISSVISSPRPNIMSLGIKDKKESFDVKVQTTLIDEAYVLALYADNSPAFTKELDNFISLSVGIEIKISSSTSIAQVALATQTAIANVSDLTATGTAPTLIGQVLSGTYEAMHDGEPDLPNKNTCFDTNFDFAVADQVTVDNNTDLNGKYFHIHTPYRQYYIWYNVDDGAVDPELVENQKQSFLPTTVQVPETIHNTAVPICLGRCFNLEPKLIDANNHVYQVHEGKITDVLEIRANGVVLDGIDTLKPQYEVNLDIGCFRLLVHQNNTQVTCDAIGPVDKGTDATGASTTNISYDPHSAPHLVEWLALEKGGLFVADICETTFNDFPNQSPLGLYIKDETTVGPLITDIMSSVGGYSRFHRVCVLQIFRLNNPDTETSIFTLDSDLIVEKGLSLQLTEVPKASISLGYDRNWTVQDKGSLAGIISDPSQDFLYLLDLFTNEYSTVINDNVAIKSQYPLAEDKDLMGTLLSDFGSPPTTNTQDEVDRRMTLRQKKRFVYKIKSTVAPFTLSIGDTIHVIHPRFGFEYGRNCIIIGMDERPTKLRVDLEVWL